MKLAIVVPCYNEEAALPRTAERLGRLLSYLKAARMVDSESFLLFVDDGSRDRTWDVVRALASQDSAVRGVRLSRNKGHQRAVVAGLEEAREADVIVTIDADLQDDELAIETMVSAAHAGADIVYGVRRQRASDTWFKRVTAETYYRLLRLFGAEVVFNHADFRLMSRAAVDALLQFPESNLFLRGLVPQIGMRTAVVEYDRRERMAGESKYPLAKMLGFAWEGVTSLSATPLRFITVLGLSACALALGTAFWASWVWLFTDRAVPGWASTLVPIGLFGGVQLLSLGVIGEYIGKMYIEAKRRPRYFVSERAGRLSISPRTPAVRRASTEGAGRRARRIAR